MSATLPTGKTSQITAEAEKRRENTKPRPGYSGVEEHSAPFHSFLEHSATFAFPGVLIAALYYSSLHLVAYNMLWLLAPIFILAWVAADFISGVVHWACDTYGTENTPIFGQAMIKPFRLHHIYPRDITTHNFVVTNGNTCIVSIPAVGAILAMMLAYEGEPSLLLGIGGALMTLITFATVMTNQFHKWSHAEKVGPVIGFLQKYHLILNVAYHAKHHAYPHDKVYTITCGWLSPFLDKIKFFRGLEYILAKVGIQMTGR